MAIVLIIIGLGLGYFGFTKLDNNQASIEVGDLEFSAGDKSDTTTAYVLMGLGGLCLLGGFGSILKK